MLTKWYENENLLKLTPALNKEVKDLARNVRKKDFHLIWDVLRDAVGAGTMTIESVIFHVSGKSKDEVGLCVCVRVHVCVCVCVRVWVYVSVSMTIYLYRFTYHYPFFHLSI